MSMPRLSISGASGVEGANNNHNSEILPLQRTATNVGAGNTTDNPPPPSSPSPPPTTPSGSLRRQSTMRSPSIGSMDSVKSPQFPGGIALGSTINNSHVHHYHYHLYQTTVNESSGDKDKDEEDEEKEDAEADADLQELMELFPDGIPDELLMDDGSGIPQEVVDENGNVITVIKPRQKAVKAIFGVHDLSGKEQESLTFFARVYRFLHDPSSSLMARVWSVLMVLAIITSSTMILLQSMPNLKFLDSVESITEYVEFYSVILFSTDYLLKLFSVHSYADCILPKPLPYNVLIRFFIQPLNLLDFISVVPFWVQYVLGAGATSGNTISLVFRVIRMMRIIRLLKVAQYSRSIDIFFRVIIQAWDALLLLLFFVGFGSIVFGTLIFLCESGELQDDPLNNATFGKYMRPNAVGDQLEATPFSSIPVTFWYVVTTLTTVGYGDMYPTSTIGRLIGGCTMLSGVIFISTPLVIFGTHFQNEFTKELERVAFVHRRQEKIKRKKEEQEKKEREKEKADREARLAANPGAFGMDPDDPMAMGFMKNDTSDSPLPGQVPSNNAYATTSEGGDDGLNSFSANRPFANRKTSILVRGSTFGGRPSLMGGGGGFPNLADVAIRVMEGGSSPSLRGMAGNNQLIPNMSTLGPNGCTCTCICGARNLAGSQIPGENVIGGVRRSIFAKNGSKVTQPSQSIVQNPTAADQTAMKKGMELAQSVLPDRQTTERSAQQMASSAGSTMFGNLSAANVLEMQHQLESLKQAVSQLGGLLIAGGAPAPAIAKAMMDSVVPPEPEKKEKSSRKSFKSLSKAALTLEKTAGEGNANGETSSSDTATPPARSSTMQPRPSISQQPSSGKLSKTPQSGPSKSPDKIPPPLSAGTPAKRTSITASSPTMAPTAGVASPTLVSSPTPAKKATPTTPTMSPSLSPAPSPPPAAKSSPVITATPAPAQAPAVASTSAPAPVAAQTPAKASPVINPTAAPASSATPKPAPFGFNMSPDPEPTPSPQPSVTEMTTLASPSGAASPTPSGIASPSAIASPTPEPTPAKPVYTGPVALTIDEIVPAREKRTFPPAPPDESTTECTIRMLESMIEQPKLTEKLLMKPPFRFIHDIVSSMIRTVGFPESYFDPREMEPKNMTEIGPKLEFLEKLLDLISIINQCDLSHINPKKIVAGMEFENTNQMLQEFAKAAATGITVAQVTAMMEAQEQAQANGEGPTPTPAP